MSICLRDVEGLKKHHIESPEEVGKRSPHRNNPSRHFLPVPEEAEEGKVEIAHT